MLFAIFVPYFIENKKSIAILYTISILSGATLLIEQRYLDWKIATYASNVFIPLALIFMISIDILLILLFLEDRESWLEKNISQ